MLSSLLSLIMLITPVSSELKFVIAIWRHGDRAPDSLPYPLDTNTETSWPRGWDQLTNTGIYQMYELGQWFRTRYITSSSPLLKKNFDYKEVVYKSSDKERAIQSAQSHATGMYPATDNFIWANDSTLRSWQPIPIHTNGLGRDDPLLKSTSMDCGGYDDIVEDIKQDLYENYTHSYQELFDKLTDYTGMNISYGNFNQLYDITREIAHQMPQPSWVTERWNNMTIIDHLKQFKLVTQNAKFDTVQKSKFRAGYLINDWCAKLQAASNGSLTEKAYLYSSHDGTLSAFSYAMGISDHELIPYAASYIAELHNNSGKHTVQLFYRKSSQDLQQVKLTNCTIDCPLDQFLQQLEDVRIRTVEELHQICYSSVVHFICTTTILFIFYWF